MAAVVPIMVSAVSSTELATLSFVALAEHPATRWRNDVRCYVLESALEDQVCVAES